MTSASTTRQRTLGAVAAVALLVLSACSGGGAGSDGVASASGDPTPANASATEDPAPLDPDAQALVFAGCMRDNGVDMPDPGPGQEGLGAAFQAVAGDYDESTLQQAIGACQDLIPQYVSGEHSGDDWMLELAECLRGQGLDVSDNPFEEAHSGAIDVGEFTAAMEVCRDVVTGTGG